jgi:hypothetical protein
MSIVRLVVSGVIMFSLVACSSTTMVRSTDPQAKIYLDGEYRGTGTVTDSNTKIVGSSTLVKIQKDGCEPETYSYSKNEEFDVGACAGGVFVLIPFLWIMKYKPEHVYEYKCRRSH